MENWATLQTMRCIVTGEPATCWAGHVVAETLAGPLKICAGFKDEETMSTGMVKAATDSAEHEQGYLGKWKPRDGIQAQQTVEADRARHADSGTD